MIFTLFSLGLRYLLVTLCNTISLCTGENWPVYLLSSLRLCNSSQIISNNDSCVSVHNSLGTQLNASSTLVSSLVDQYLKLILLIHSLPAYDDYVNTLSPSLLLPLHS